MKYAKALLINVIAVFLAVDIVSAQTSCDNCPPPQVVLYGIDMRVPQPPPDDTLGQYTSTSSYHAFLNWLALGDAIVPVADIVNSDPEKGCVNWYDGTLAQELAANPDTNVTIHVQNYSTGDVPPLGPVPGVDYLVWSTIDSGGGEYTINVYLEDAYSRTRIATGSSTFADPNNSVSAAASAISQIEPVFDKIRAYQKQMRDNSDQIAISATIDLQPSKDEMNGGETIPVSVQAYDCDGGPGVVPLTNRWIRLKATNGHFDLDSVQTDANGRATANFTADNVTDVANLTGLYYPYFTPSHKMRGSWGDTTVNINMPPTRNWVMNVSENYVRQETITESHTGYYYSSNSVTYSNAKVTQYFVGELTDTSVSIDELVGGKGYTSIGGNVRTLTLDGNDYSNETVASDAQTSPDEDFEYSIGLGDVGPTNGGITFTSELSLDLVEKIHLFSNNSGSTITYDTTYTFPGYPDAYIVFATQRNPYFPGIGSFSGSDSGYVYSGTYGYDTTITGDGNRKDVQHLGEHVTATFRPYQTPTAAHNQKNDIPTAYGLSQNYPNPFNPTTVIQYQLPASSLVTLKIYDVLGREIKTLVDARQNPGKYSITFDGRVMPSGVYFYRLSAGGFSSVKKFVLVK